MSGHCLNRRCPLFFYSGKKKHFSPLDIVLIYKYNKIKKEKEGVQKNTSAGAGTPTEAMHPEPFSKQNEGYYILSALG